MKQLSFLACICSLAACSVAAPGKNDKVFVAEQGTENKRCSVITAHAPDGEPMSAPRRLCGGWKGRTCGDIVAVRAKQGANVEGFVTGPEFVSEVDLKEIDYLTSENYESLRFLCTKDGMRLVFKSTEETSHEVVFHKTGHFVAF